MKASDELKALKNVIPLTACMTFEERLAAWRFLSALITEYQGTARKMRNIPKHQRPKWFDNAILYWDHAAAGLKLARNRLGIPKGEENYAYRKPLR